MLASLLDGPLHGYAIIKRTEELSGGRVRMATGTLYTALDRLAAEGYIRPVSEEIVNGRARRSYGLTEPGAAALRAEAARMAAAARLVTSRARPPYCRPARPRRCGLAGGEPGMTAIERRYQRLLRAYPGWYREQRGDEMLGTLMAAAPSGRWPSRRDSGR